MFLFMLTRLVIKYFSFPVVVNVDEVNFMAVCQAKNVDILTFLYTSGLDGIQLHTKVNSSSYKCFFFNLSTFCVTNCHVPP